MLSSINGGLCEIAVDYEVLIKQALPIAATSPQREERVRKSIDQLVRVARQIERFSDKEQCSKPRQQSKIVDVQILENPPAEPPVSNTESGELQS